MNGALWFLVWRTFTGRIRRMLRLLRQPKYLVGALFAVLYFGWVFRNSLASRRRNGLADLTHGLAPDAVVGVAALAALVLITFLWIVPGRRKSALLTETEQYVLLSAPLPRRALKDFLFWRNLPQLLVSAAIFSVVLVPGGVGNKLLHFIPLWLVGLMIDAHAKGVDLWRQVTRRRPLKVALVRVLAPPAALLMIWALIAWKIRSEWEGIAAALPANHSDAAEGTVALTAALSGFAHVVSTGVVGVLLMPLRWAVAPIFIGPTGTPWWSIFGALAIAALHREWICRSEVAFEEPARAAAPAASADTTARRTWWRLGTRHTSPFVLGSRGLPETALVWKNLTKLVRVPLGRVAACALLACAALAIAMALSGAPRMALAMLTMIALSFPAFAVLMTGMWFKNDLRQDLGAVALLRAWPIAGWRLVAAETVAPAIAALGVVLLSCGVLLALDVGVRLAIAWGRTPAFDWWTLTPAMQTWGAPPLLVPYLMALGALPLAAGLALMSASLQNLGALLLPGWMTTAQDREAGFAAVGQRMLQSILMLVAMIIGVVPAALLLGGVLLLQRFAGLPVVAWEFPVLGLVAAVPLVALAAVCVVAGGRLWDALDPAREILEV